MLPKIRLLKQKEKRKGKNEMVPKTQYSFSFTGASALLAETLIIAEQYLRFNDWEKVKDSILDKNLMNKRKQSTSVRKFREIRKRLELLTKEQMNLLVNGSVDESKVMIALSVLKKYAFLKDFIVEVVRSKYLLFNNTISDSDYMSFFYVKSITNRELNEITEKTTNKVKQVLFKLLEQIGLIQSAKDGVIIKPFLSDDAIKVIVDEDASNLAGFLYSDAEIRTLKKSLVND